MNDNIDGTSALKIDSEDKQNDNVISLVEALDKEVQPNLKGKKITEDGKIEDTATNKTVTAVGRGVSAFFTKGESLRFDQQITNSRMGSNLLGVVSDTLDKVPGVEQTSEALDEINVLDTANSAMDTVGNALNGDVVGTVKSGAKTIKETEKTAKIITKKTLLMIAIPVSIIALAIFAAAISPQFVGNLDVTNDEASLKNNNNSFNNSNSNLPPIDGNYVDASYVDNMDIKLTEEQLNYLKNNIPNWDNLTQFRKNVLMASYSCVGVTSYSWGSRPSAAGISGTLSGLDCSGFVSWSIWTASGNPFNQTTASMADNIGNNGLVSISKESLQAGDFVVVRRPNDTGHALIYAGNNQYIHLAGKGQKAKISGYTFQSDWSIYYASYAG